LENEVKLSVIIICKNEEEFINRCIESVILATDKIPSSEIILVDSASIDRTIEIAKKYPIKIIQLDPFWPLSASAGRYIGCYFSRGKYVQFVDGDMLLNDQWLQECLKTIEDIEGIAGIVGIPSQEPYETYLAKQFTKTFTSFVNTTKEGRIKLAEGAIFFKKDILEKSGSWNPYLVAEEERELSRRIVNLGYVFYFLKKPSTHHLGAKHNENSGILKKVKVYATGQGQLLRYSLNSNALRKYWISYSKSFLIITFLSILGVIALLSVLILKILLLFYLFFILTLGYIGILILKKNSIVKGIAHFSDQLLKFPFILRGFLKKPKDPITYPVDVKVIKNEPVNWNSR
jgi:glycosyltransferase involved in cell wall biosynthesis